MFCLMFLVLSVLRRLKSDLTLAGDAEKDAELGQLGECLQLRQCHKCRPRVRRSESPGRISQFNSLVKTDNRRRQMQSVNKVYFGSQNCCSILQISKVDRRDESNAMLGLLLKIIL